MSRGLKNLRWHPAHDAIDGTLFSYTRILKVRSATAKTIEMDCVNSMPQKGLTWGK